MSASLNEITYQRLHEFRRRRLVLSRSRGWSVVVSVFVAALLLAVIVDAVSTNSWLRWSASGLVYVATAVAWFMSCWLPTRQVEPLQVEAKRFEDADPRLREQLLTAVEFADESAEKSAAQPFDSSAFKDQLQTQVAKLIAPVDVKQLLPWRLVQRALYVALASILFVLLLAFVPQLHWMNRVARALLPAANLDRIARVAIVIEEPQPNSRVIAAGDIVGVVARIDGKLQSNGEEKLSLETRTASGELNATPMQSQFASQVVEQTSAAHAEPADRYHATVSCNEEWIEYRVAGAGAATRWHRLTTQPRPEVENFEITLTPPAYTSVSPIVQISSSGNIQALVGTRVKLKVTVNQSVSFAELRWQTGSESEAIKFDRDASDNAYVAEFTVEKSDSYRIHLQSAETNFVNEFSPSYSVEAVTDLAPQVAWVKPTESKQIVAADQILTLEAQASDEFPIVSIKQLLRLNQEESWIPTELDLASLTPVSAARGEPAQSLAGERVTAAIAWRTDLLKTSTSVGDVVEMKLVAQDCKGQVTESDVIEFLISESSTTSTPTPTEISRQRIAAEIESFEQRIKQQVATLDGLANPKQKAESEDDRAAQSAIVIEAAKALNTSIVEQVPSLLSLVQQASVEAEDAVSLLELEQTGQVLASLQSRNVRELATAVTRLSEPTSPFNAKQRSDLEKDLVQHAKRIGQIGNSISTDFRAISSHDVGRRLSAQVAKLQQLFLNYTNALDQASSTPVESAKRQAVVLSRQLVELQQSMLDSLPGVRQETKQRVRQSADSIANLATQFDSVMAQADVSKFKAQAEQIEKNLSQSKNASWFDGGLHDAVINGHRRLAEFGGQPADGLRRVLANMVAEKEKISVEIAAASVEAVTENLAERRTLSRSRKEGDREFASDLGLALRALKAINDNASYSKSDQHREMTESAAAIETLQAVHGFKEASSLLEELLRGERWSLSSSDARVHHPIVFESFAERLDNAVKLLRQAKVPQEIVGEIEKLRWHEATQKAGQKINARRWENSPSVSAAAEMNQISELLAASRPVLAELAAKARLVLSKQAPTLEQLAEKAATATRELQEQTASLASAIERKEVPDATQRLAQLQAEQVKSQQPIAELRDALVDHADAQNLLDTKQLITARETDAALAVVDSAKQDVEDSMQRVATPAEQTPLDASLVAASEQQATATSKLEQLADYLQRAAERSKNQDEESQPAEQPSASEALMQLAEELGNDSESAKRFNEAEQLARLSAARPEEVLRQLEQKLATNKPMQEEMSRIAQELAEQALNRLDRAANQQQRMQPSLEASDPKFLAQKNLLVRDLQTARENANQVLALLVSEAKWTAGAGKDEASQKQIEATEQQLRSAIAVAEKSNVDRTYEELRSTAKTLAGALSGAQEELSAASQKLKEASSEKIHQNDADLANRRREMQERLRRIAQQDVRNMQQFERSQQQALRQAENELKQSTQREKSLEQIRSNMQKEVDKHPENDSLKQQLKDATRNLAFGEAQKQAAEQTKQELARRVEAAMQNREATEKKTQADLSSVNPSAQLSAELAQNAADRSSQLAKQLGSWAEGAAAELKPQASAGQLQSSAQEERSIESSVQDSADDLARAARHEGRLKNQATGQKLAEQADATENLNRNEIDRAEQSLSSAIENAKRPDSATGQADAATTSTAMTQIQSADSAIRGRADQLREMLAELAESSSAQSHAEVDGEANSSSQLLDAQQLAQLLDEVDRQLNPGQKATDTNSQSAQQAAAGQPSSKQTPSTLAAAAEKIASQLSRNRAPSPQGKSDQASASESSSANVDPQAPVTVKVIDVNRIGSDWGKLRERAAEDMIESRRESVSSAYRQQIEAYFRSLAERGQATEVKP